MIVYLHSADMFDAGRTFGRHESLSDVIHITIPMSFSVTQIATETIARVVNQRSIWLLILNAHGAPGDIGLGTGITSANVRELNRLRDYMTPDGRGVEIHSCMVASDWIAGRPHVPEYENVTPRAGVGTTLVRNMAREMNCTVRAAYENQSGVGYLIPGILPASGNDYVGVFEGRWICVQPNGTYTEHDPGI